jgi:hypothetical protein
MAYSKNMMEQKGISLQGLSAEISRLYTIHQLSENVIKPPPFFLCDHLYGLKEELRRKNILMSFI